LAKFFLEIFSMRLNTASGTAQLWQTAATFYIEHIPAFGLKPHKHHIQPI
jgi:hypothetical protein